MTKQELLGYLDNMLTAFVASHISLGVASMLPDEHWPVVESVVFHNAPVGHPNRRSRDFPVDALRKASPEEWENLKQSVGRLHVRAMLREAHELVTEYVEQTNQEAAYKAESWYDFARIIRHSVSHGSAAYLARWPPDLIKAGITSVKWRHITLTQAMASTKTTPGAPLLIGAVDALDLYSDIRSFAEKELA